MPHSLVLNLLPQSPISPQYLTGRHLHALFLTLVSAVDQQLGDNLHNEKSEKAFTLSPLQINGHQRFSHGIYSLEWEYHKPIPAGTPCWWRVSLLDDTLFSRLTPLWLNLNPQQPWHLGPADLHITGILGTPRSSQPWANATTYAQLYEQASEVDRQIALTICSPAGFRQGQYDSALPTRECVFGSLLHRWNKYSGIEFSGEFLEKVFPSFFDIRTEMVADSRSKFIGCLGEISYRILGDVEPQAIKQINALADFALYCGIGRKTPMGMGMIRRVGVHTKVRP
ncbi:CRISPR-associated endoribonuclease Cas6 [Microcoleus sp. FACHB-68]|uniref:CRISPR-associated endoribonuclease Cas6 n=1 Tax=Microcoleus sp. FACHB-68 TaxID=2692826 RepID=UPI00168903C6|nr:CRISPR-associated endoribonuclease Cas6 [Microcoleus sp. FACHB-68]MBD1935748.1 CRISPR-associated endoribonuclease Cas6 [Microcoleus sp. FACHB-68]